MPKSLSTSELPPPVRQLCQQLKQAGYRAWLVGGCVRDSLLAQQRGETAAGSWVAKDFDIATDAVPSQVQAVFKRVIPTGVDHGTVTVLLGGMDLEVTTLRTEQGYADGRRPDGVSFVTSLEDDLARRDFTVNAIAFDPDRGELIAPHGGLGHLVDRRLVAVGDALQRFSEDGLRVLRAARLAATLEFDLDPATEDAIRPSLTSFRQVSAERIRDEWHKALKAREPSRAYRLMREHGLLEASAPELDALSADVWQRCLRRVDRAARSVPLRLAALLLDLHGEPEQAARLADALLERLRHSGAERKFVGRCVLHQQLPEVDTASNAELRRWLHRVGADLWQPLCDLRDATPSSADSGPLRSRIESVLQAQPALSVKELALGGRELMQALQLRPGRHIGELLSQLLEHVLEHPESNTEEQLLEECRRLLAQSPPV